MFKADRSVLQRLITSYEAGRHVDLGKVMCHELLPVPIAIAEMNGELRSGVKANLAQVLAETLECPPTTCISSTELGNGATLVIDGHPWTDPQTQLSASFSDPFDLPSQTASTSD